MERICWRECLDELESHSIMHVSFALKSACVRYLVLCTSHTYFKQQLLSTLALWGVLLEIYLRTVRWYVGLLLLELSASVVALQFVFTSFVSFCSHNTILPSVSFPSVC